MLIIDAISSQVFFFYGLFATSLVSLKEKFPIAMSEMRNISEHAQEQQFLAFPFFWFGYFIDCGIPLGKSRMMCIFISAFLQLLCQFRAAASDYLSIL